MLASKGKISARQTVILLILLTMSPAIRLFPQATARFAGKAGWLAPIVAVIPMIILILLLNSAFKNKSEANLSDLYFDILGNIAGRIVLFFYIVWILVLLALYTRYYSERILSSIQPGASNCFLIITMLFLVFMATKKGIVTIARSGEIFIIIFMLVLTLSMTFSLPEIKYRNIMNVSYLDAWPVAKASVDIFAVWGYFLFLFFFADKINDKENIKKFGLQGLLFLFIITLLGLIMVIGSLGSRLASHVSLPYFMVVKNISILETVDHIEPVVLALWVISDFMIISVFTVIAVSLIKSFFGLSHDRHLVSPIVLFTGIGAMYFFENRFELEAFSSKIAVPTNILLEFIIPIIIIVIGKIRKKI
jgi:spore germination protein KB